LTKAIKLLQAETADLRELAHLAGADPRIFYRGIRLEDLDVGDLNIQRMEFSTPLPVLNLTDPAVQKMIETAQAQGGYAIRDKIDTVLCNQGLTVEQIEVAFEMLLEMGIKVVERDAASVLRAISAHGRQEERIAALLEAILYDYNSGISALVQFKHDKAKFANKAISLIRQNLLTEESPLQQSLLTQESPSRRDEIIVARLVSRLLRAAFPTSRGLLLYFFAMHLAVYPLVNQAIRECLDRSNSLFIAPYRAEIERLLLEGIDDTAPRPGRP
jgi:Sigma-70 factor, region 1.1